MDDRLSDHLRKERTKRILLVTVCHIPLLAYLFMGFGSTTPPRWSVAFSIILVVIADIILMIDLFLDYTIFQSFQPRARGPPFKQDGFERLSYTSNDGTVMPMWHHAESGGGLAVFLHGWTSCSHYQFERMKAMWTAGWSTVALDLRGHGEAPPTSVFSSVQAAIDVHHAIAELRRMSLIKEDKLLIHGHSLGGYVAQRVLKTWDSTHSLRPRLILESPLIDLPLIMIHKTPWMSPVLPLVLRRIARLTQLIEPKSPPWSAESFGPPHWGSFEEENILYIQASVDRTLGTAQAEAAKRAYPWLKVHVIENLEHSARGSNPSRDAVIMDWLKNHSDSDSI